MSPSRGLAPASLLRDIAIRKPTYTCPRCLARPFSVTTTLSSGHNRWSKIKHDKGKADAVKNRQRSIFAQEIAAASKQAGPDPNLNTRLADLISKAKKEGFAKASIEAAIARGQGRSVSGASLEALTIEGILPNNVAVIIECETDSKSRTLMDVRLVMKTKGGTSTPSSYLFGKRGRIIFEKKEDFGMEEALESVLEAGALDLEEDDRGRLVVYAEPADTKAVGDTIAQSHGLQIATSEILWEPNEDTMAEVPSEGAAQDLCDFVDELQEKDTGVQAVAMNVARGSLSDDAWGELTARLST